CCICQISTLGISHIYLRTELPSLRADRCIFKYRISHLHIFKNLYYSVLKFFTGFTVEALYVLDNIVINPINNKNKKPESNVPAPKGTLLGKFCKNMFDKI